MVRSRAIGTSQLCKMPYRCNLASSKDGVLLDEVRVGHHKDVEQIVAIEDTHRKVSQFFSSFVLFPSPALKTDNLQSDTDAGPELGGRELKGVDVSVVRASSSKGAAQVTENQLGVSVSVALTEAGLVLEILLFPNI